MTPSQDLRAVYPGNKWDGLQVSLVRIYKGLAVPPRMLIPKAQANTVVMWHILKGEVSVQYRDLKASSGPGGWLVCLPGERLQCFGESTHLISIHLRVECPANGARWVGPHLLCLGRADSLSRAAAKLRNVVARWNLCCDNFTDEQYIVPFPGALAIHSALSALLLGLLPLLVDQGVRLEPANSQDARVSEGLRWLATQPLKHPFSRADLAQLAGLSPSRLDRLWKESLGVTPYQYWENRRLKLACDRLRERRLLIKEIAFDLGFSHVSQFSTWFRAHHGESPRTFRNRPESV